MPIEQQDFFEAVISQRLGDIEHMVHKMLEIVVDRAGKVHHVTGIAIRYDRQD